MPDPLLDANKALVRAHYDAVTNGHDPAAIRAQLPDDFFDHAAGKRCSADEVIAHSRLLHETFAQFRVVIDAIVAEADLVASMPGQVTRH